MTILVKLMSYSVPQGVLRLLASLVVEGHIVGQNCTLMWPLWTLGAFAWGVYRASRELGTERQKKAEHKIEQMNGAY